MQRLSDDPFAGIADRGLSGVFSGIHETIGQRARIGRDAKNDIVVDDLLVSRFHAELRARSDGLHELIDLGSANGTFVNGRSVDRAIVEELDVVRRRRLADADLDDASGGERDLDERLRRRLDRVHRGRRRRDDAALGRARGALQP
jgi:pSer/pThr/pTyr-binding forkhead associated (FHA) protein